ncbi:MAG: hypothetical protein ACRC6K_00085 [Fusobacteriaceae bacterium]
MFKYLKCNMMGNYEIAFLPYSGGLLDQEWDWVDDIETILRCLNSQK